MSMINDAFINALLADATYVDDLEPGFTGGTLAEKVSKRMTPVLAELIGRNFTVLTQIDSPDGLGTGFDATVWRGNVGTSYEGKVYVSTRGTEGLQDFLTDGDLAFSGNARFQIASMVNWWLRETTPAGQSALQIEAVIGSSAVNGGGDYTFFQPALSAIGTGRLASVATIESVNGHSLGGYLATAFNRLFGEKWPIGHTSTFNSAGFTNGSEGPFRELESILGTGVSKGRFATASEQSNYFAKNGINVTTNTLWFNQIGHRIDLFNELSTDTLSVPNHYMYKLTDSLALGNALSKLDSTLTIEKLNQLLEAGSNHSKSSIESVFDGLRRVFLGGDIASTTVADVGNSTEPRPSYHSTLDSLQNKANFKALEGKLLVKVSSADLRAAARNSFAVLVALQDLSPIVVGGKDSAANDQLKVLWQSTRPADYTAWEADKSTSTPATFTDKWIADRAVLLEAIVARNIKDGDDNLAYSSALPSDRAYELHWKDADGAARTLFAVNANRPGGVLSPVARQEIWFGGAGSDELTGSNINKFGDHLYGGDGNDTLSGLAGDDYLEGGAGGDILLGGTGDDTLVGGAGTDTYRFGTGWGVDRIIDSDGLGSIEVNGQALTGGKAVGEGAWESDDRQWRYGLSEQKDLIITHASEPGRIIVQGWARMKQQQDKPLGLDLPGLAGSPQPPQPGTYVYQGDQLGPNDADWRLLPDGRIPGAVPNPNANDLFDGSSIFPDKVLRLGGMEFRDGAWMPVGVYTHAVKYMGLGGNDFISGEQYDDELDGGDGDDVIWGGAGSDRIKGGAGDDIIVSNMAATMPGGYGELPRAADEIKGPDNVVAQTRGSSILRWFVVRSADGSWLRVERAHVKNPQGGEFYTPESESDQDVIDAGEGNDYVWAGRGADYIIGGGGDDRLAGLGGNDLILGGDGKDVIYGDDWARMRLEAVYSSREGEVYGFLPRDEALKSPVLHGNDVIDGGAGDDEVWGDGGDDVILGGSGKDVLYGDGVLEGLPIEYHGNDKLDGGDGDDLLFGMGKDDVLLGGAGNDQLQGDNVDIAGNLHGADFLDGGDGDDLVVGDGGNDVLYGGAGNDQLQGDNTVIAGNLHGADFLDGGDGNDTLFGDGGDDVLHGGAGDDWIAGEDETGVNSVSALTGNDSLFGGDGNDTLVGGNGDDKLSGGEGDDGLYGGAGADWLDGGTGRNVLKGGTGNDTYVVTSAGTHIIADADGHNVVQGVEGLAVGVTLQGDLVLRSDTRTVVLSEALGGGFSGEVLVNGVAMGLEDYIDNHATEPLVLAGSTRGQRFVAGRGDDEIVANGANSLVRAGRGADQITLNAEGGVVALRRGDGHDRVVLAASSASAPAGTYKVDVQLGEGITAGDVSFEYDAGTNALKLRYSPDPDDVLDVTYGGMLPPSVMDVPPVGVVRLADGSVLELDFSVQSANEDAPYTYKLPDKVFEGMGAGATLAASLAGGRPWPAWLHFDAATRTFSGTPGNGDVGGLSVRVSATLGQSVVSHTFALFVRDVNDAPVAGAPLAPFVGKEQEAWTYSLPEGSFADEDVGDTLTYSAKLADGQPLPTWLRINSQTGQLSHAQGSAQATRLSLLITATDAAGATADQALELTLESALDPRAVLGTPGDDTLVGGAGNETLIGGLGADVLDGGGGDDVLVGGNSTGTRDVGDSGDVYLLGRGGDEDTIWSGGTGTLKFKAGIRPEDISVSRGIDTVAVWGPGMSWRPVPSGIIFTIVSTGERVMVPNFHGANGLGGGKIDRVTFTDHPDVVWDTDAIGRLALLGSAGNEEISGYASDDVLRGNAGNDTLRGQWGNDTYQYGKNDGRDVIYEHGNEGADRIVLDSDIVPGDVVLLKVFDEPSTYPLGVLVVRVKTGNTEIRVPNFFQDAPGAGVDSVEFANGTVWDRGYIAANAQGSVPVAEGFMGTSGDDHYVVDHVDDRIVEREGEGVDSVESSVSYSLPNHVENLTLTGYGSINAKGNAGNNVLVGNGADNVLDWGGGGADTLQGGLGNDTYVVNAPAETFFYFSPRYEDNEAGVNIVEAAGGGVDELRTNTFYARLPENVENLRVPSFMATSFDANSAVPPVAKYFGNALDNVIDLGAITFSYLPTELDGGAGNDLLIGTRGSEDRASYASATAAVTVSLQVSGPQNTLGAGSDTLKDIEGLVGSQFDDVLTGNERDNVLVGGAGADRMVGGQGNDTYYIDHVNDIVVEAADEGYKDMAYVTGLTDFTLADHIENLHFSPGQSANVSVTGNDGDNSITVVKTFSSMGPVVVRGMGGNDSLTASFAGMELDGGSGNDYLAGFRYGGSTFVGGTGDDTYVIFGYGSGDVIRANSVAVPSETNTLYMMNLSRAALRFRRQGNDLVIPSGGSGNYLTVEKFFNAAGEASELSPVQFIALDEGPPLGFADIKALVKEPTAPVAQEPMAPLDVQDGQSFSWSVPPMAFVDNDGYIASYSATLEDGSPLLSWATFSSDDCRLSGTVRANGSETLRIKITATDQDGLSTSGIFELRIVVQDKTITGTAGNDTLRGGGGNDTISGLGGKDQIQGGGGNDRLLGGAGDDSLFGQAGMDTLIGGQGNDSLNGGTGNDTFEYTKGDGQDTLDATDAKTAVDRLLIHGWTPSQTQLVRSGNHLLVRMGGSTDQVALYNHFQADSTQDGAAADSKIDQIVFDNGEVWDQAKIDAVLAGGGGGNTGGGSTPTPPPSSYTYAHVLADQYSDYTLSGNAPYVFKGNSRANKLTGNDGANVINGAAGNDTLAGGKGGDTYFLEAGTGQDTIVENDSTAGVDDLLQWGSNIRHDQIWLRKSGNNLEVSVIGTSDKAIVKDWYLGASRHVEQIWAGGKMLSDAKAQALVDAMAAFSPPPAGQTTLNASYQAALNPVIVANWQ